MKPACVCLGMFMLAMAGGTLASVITTLRAPPQLLAQVSFDQKLGVQVPLDLEFHDATGAAVRLRDLLGERPTVLVPGYYGCSNICGAVRAGVAHAVANIGFVAGKQFNVVLVSINPHETPADAKVAQINDELAHPGAQVAHWHYLTSAAAVSMALTRSIGFGYLFDARNGQYDHAAGIVLLTPQGKIAQYLFGVQFAPQTLRLALVGASQGHIGSIVDRLLLLCCDYDASTGRYSLLINRVMQGLGILTVLTVGGLIAILKRKERRADGNGARP